MLVSPTPSANLPVVVVVVVAHVLSQVGKATGLVRVLNSSIKNISLYPHSKVAEISRPAEVIPSELLVFEVRGGEIHVRQPVQLGVSMMRSEPPVIS